jgi:quinol monooxygenase YgiN
MLLVALVFGSSVVHGAGGVSQAGQNLDAWTLWTGSTVLRGANIYQRRVYPELDGEDFLGTGIFGPPFGQSDFDALAAMGANYVNISCSGLFAEKPPYELDEAAQANLDALLGMAAAADLFAVISFRAGPGRAEFSICCYGEDWYDPEIHLDDSVWTTQAAQDAWVAMWRHTAERYRDNPVVVGYDLMVEPNANEVLFDEWDPQAFYDAHGDTLADWDQLFPRIVDAIREVDQLTPVLVQHMGYSAVDWLPLMKVIDDERTVYAVHQYQPYVFTHQEPPLTNTYPGVFDADEDGTAENVDREWLDALLGTVDEFISDHGVVVAVNEMGVMRWEPGAEVYLSDEIELLESRGLNWAVWAWEPQWPPWTTEVTEFNFRMGPDPSNTQDVPGNALETVVTGAWDDNSIRPSSTAGEPLFLAAAANLPGLAGTRWRTDLELKALGDGGVTLQVELLERDRDSSSTRSVTLMIEGGRSRRLVNVLDELFNYQGAAALRLTPLSGQVLATSRTFTRDAAGGSFGQFMPVVPESEATSVGESAELIQLTGIPGTPGFRTNIGLVNVTSTAIEVIVDLHGADGGLLGTQMVTLAPLEFRQLGEVLAGLGQGPIGDACASVTTSTVGGAFLAYASVVDNQTGDAILIPGIGVVNP